MSDWFENNQRVRTVDIHDRALHYGDGLFETIAVRDGEPRLWDRHMRRLSAGCELLGFLAPDSVELRELVSQAISRSTVSSNYCLTKIVMTAPGSGRGYSRSRQTLATIRIGIYRSNPLSRTVYKGGAELVNCKTVLAAPSATAGLKTLNRIEQVLARQELRHSQAFEGVMQDAGKRIICGTMSNLFFVLDDAVVTPDLSQCGVAGVMRGLVVDVLKERQCKIRIDDVEQSLLANAKEMFLTNSQFGIVPVAAFGEWRASSFEQTETFRRYLLDAGIVESGDLS